MAVRAESMSSAGSMSDRDVDSGEGFGHDTTGNVRANPVTIQWLLEHFELADGVSLPRSTIFAHYLHHCDDKAIDAMNPATFGKTIRSVFNGLRSRRLGTRGHSRYHYYGLRMKPASPLMETTSEEPAAIRSKSSGAKPSRVRTTVTVAASNPSLPRSQSPSVERQVSTQAVASSSVPHVNGEEVEHFPEQQRVMPSLLSNDVEWERVDAQVAKASIYPITSHDLRMFRDLYRKHCEAILDAVLSLKFASIEALWSTFWRARFDEEAEKMLPFDKFYLVIGCTAVQDLIIEIDVEFFDSVVHVLIQDVLRPIPSSLTQIIRNFAKSMEGWVRESMAKMPRRLVHLKLLAASALAQTLRRYTSLNHLAQAARTVLTNPAQTGTMLSDISRLDMNSIYRKTSSTKRAGAVDDQNWWKKDTPVSNEIAASYCLKWTSAREQGSLMCPCDFNAVKRYSDEFKGLLSEFDAHDRWSAWIDKILDSSLNNVPKTALATSSQEFCQKWSYFSSLAIRDLTLRSAASFGSFHLIRLLFDEYVVYAVEQRTARAASMSSLSLFFQHLTRLYPFSDNEVILPGRTSHITPARVSVEIPDATSSARSPKRFQTDFLFELLEL